MRNHRECGNAIVEMTLIGIPIMFVLISIFEISRGMWVYHTLAHTVKEGTRFGIVRGINCATAPNACTATVAQVATVIKDAGVGLVTTDLNVTLTSAGGTVNCNPISTCLNTGNVANNAVWPPAAGSAVGTALTITAVYPFRSALAMFWPGAGKTSFGVYNLPSSSTELIQF